MKWLWLFAGAVAAPAQAACDTANAYSFAFADRPAATLAYGNSYGYSATSGSGATQAFTVTLAQNGLTSTVVGGTQLPAISTLVTGPDATRRNLVLGGTFGGRTTDIAGGTRVVTVTFAFALPVRDVTIDLHDIDYSAGQFRDWLMVTGTAGSATYTPVVTTPFGNGNVAGVSRTATGSSVAIGAMASPLTLTNRQAGGTGVAGNNSDTGKITASFAQPVTSVTLRYGNYPLTGGETGTGQQGIGIAGVSFCPLPIVSVIKTSTPLAGPLGAYDLPGSDVVYTLTVTNSGGSAADAGSLTLVDLLPPGVVFRNSPFDAGTAAPFKVIGAGVSLPPGAATFSSNNGATWSLAPAAGYDPAVTGIRLAPAGTLAAGATVEIAFVTRIK